MNRKTITILCFLCVLFTELIISSTPSYSKRISNNNKTSVKPLWPLLQFNRENTGQSPHTGPQTNTEKWKIKIGTWVGSAIIGSNGLIYFGDASGKIFAYTSKGSGGQIGSLPTGCSAAGESPAMSPDGQSLYFASGSYEFGPPPQTKNLGLYALNLDGSLKWFYPTAKVSNSAPNIATDGTIYFVAGVLLHAVAPNGTLKWTYTLPGDIEEWLWTSPAIDPNGTIYIAADSLSAINPDGTEKWTYGSGQFVFRAEPAIASDGTIYYANGDYMHAVYPDGRPKWTKKIGYTESSPSIGPSTIYIGGIAGIMAINPNNGDIKWTFPTGGKSVDASTILGADGTIYSGSDNGWFYALNPDGTEKWKKDIGHIFDQGSEVPDVGEIDVAATMGPDGNIYFGHSGGPGAMGFHFFAIGD